ncbi:hypothetical protein PV327_005140 [Microctonus hyperodae]|uniref:F-box domain-containing protein n=1 Tax=Microctonus hyperodae TaxID=165561 RepID=A0AA39KZI2_MICHY|nr:hypothetical protein PV327_005140 [Microctonus hyperodae]
MAEIEILDHDVLIEIFSYLNIQERVRVGLVCKKWHDVVEIMMRSIHKMLLILKNGKNCKRNVAYYNGILQIRSNNPTYLGKRLKKFGSNLRRIGIHEKCRRRGARRFNFKLLTKCTALNYVRLHCIHPQSLRKFLKSLPTDNLEHLSLSYDKDFIDYGLPYELLLQEVLAKTTKLKSLIFDNLPTPELSIVRGETLEECFSRNCNVSKCLILGMADLPNLEVLNISLNDTYCVFDISKLIRNSRKLHSVSIRGGKLTETTLNELISLPNLRRLRLKVANNLSESWHKFSNLEEIHIKCLSVVSSTREQIISFLQRSRNLKTYYFDFIDDDDDDDYDYDDDADDPDELLTIMKTTFDKAVSDIRHECEYARSDWSYSYDSELFFKAK